MKSFPLIFALPFLLALTAAGQGTTVVVGDPPPPRPNILWIVSEDNSAEWLGSYGNAYAQTPNLDQLAAEGFRYSRAFANAPVCAPQRATWLSGLHAAATGNLPMRSNYGVPDAVAENNYVRHLNDAGYHTHNGNKTDFNRAGNAPFDTKDSTIVVRPFDEIDQAPWRRAPEDEPFFCIINLHVTHESATNSRNFGGNDPGEDSTLRIPEYYPNNADVRANHDSYQNNINEMDRQVGVILDNLAADGHANDTLVFYVSDHGGVLYPTKRFIFQNGIHSPLIVRIPEAFEHLRPGTPGEPVDEIISYIDLPKTFIALAGGAVPEAYQGRVFLGDGRDAERPYHFAYRERMDYILDNARAVHDGRYLYLRNYAPYAPWVVPFEYHFRQYDAVKEWQQAYEDGILPSESAAFWQPKGTPEQLFDTLNDPDCMVNLADDPAMQGRMQDFRDALRDWQLEINDAGLMPETMRDRLSTQAGITVYELVRDPAYYDLPALLDAADLATAADPDNFGPLMDLTLSDDPALRYWGTIGLLLLADDASLDMDARLQELLLDDADEIKAFAAWALIKRGDAQSGYTALDDLIRNPSFAALQAMNMIQWIGLEESVSLRPAVEAYLQLDYDTRLRIDGVQRMRRLPNYEEDYAQYLLKLMPDPGE